MPIALDVETTGLNPETDRIIQLYILEVTPQLNTQGKGFKATVNPGIPIPPEATAVHGIRDSDVQGLPGFSAVASEVQGFFRPGEVVIGYHGSFDLDFLHYELVRAGLPGVPMTQPLVDPCRIFREKYPHTLQNAVYHYLGVRFEDNHEAERDVMATLRVLGAQLKQYELSLEEAITKPPYEFVDRGRRFVRKDGVICFSFGMHRDKPVVEHEDYLRWMLDHGSFNGDTLQTVKILLSTLEQRREQR